MTLPPIAGAPSIGAIASTWIVAPHRSEPGKLGEQLAAVDCYLANPYRKIDPEAAWQLARRLCIAHARRAKP